MTRKDYVLLAEITGQTLAAARLHGGEAARTVIYEALYEPLTAKLEADNPDFDRLRFSFATGKAETAERLSTPRS